MPKNDWNEWKKLLISELDENKKFRSTVTTILSTMQTDIGGLKIKAAIAGGIAGIVGTGAVTMILSAFK